MNIDSRYSIRHAFLLAGSGERAALTLTRVTGYRRSPQGATTTPNYPLNHARSGSDNLTVSTSPARIRPRRSGPSQSYLEVIFIRFRGPQALNDNLENPGLPEMRSRRRPAPGFWPWERHCSL